MRAAETASEIADAAARAAGVTVAEVADLAGHERVADVFCTVWRTRPGDDLLSPSLIRTLSSIGGYVAGAWSGPTMVGASVGLFAADGHLHSHITGVAAAHRRRGVGFALKLHQRAWALDRGIGLIGWTFDPLVLRNAWFNLHCLGAVAVEYRPDFYGPMTDGVNAGDASDRLVVHWLLDDPSVATRLATPPTGSDDGVAVSAGAVRVEVPLDIESLRASDPDAARGLRVSVRDAMTGAFADGLVIAAVDRDGAYVFDRPRGGA